jgi:hypothetical protein
MSSYAPPTENVAIFDSINFTSGDIALTQDQADKRYLRFPNAQGKETLQIIDVNGLATFNNNIVQAGDFNIAQATTTNTRNTLKGSSVTSSWGTTSANHTLNAGDSISGNTIGFYPNLPASNYNPIVQVNDRAIVANAGSLVATVGGTTTNSGIRINSSSTTIGQGGTTSTPSSFVRCDASGVTLSSVSNITIDPNNTLTVDGNGIFNGQQIDVSNNFGIIRVTSQTSGNYIQSGLAGGTTESSRPLVFTRYFSATPSLFLDVSNNRIAINKNNPTTTLDVNGNTTLNGTLDMSGNSITKVSSITNTAGDITISTSGDLNLNPVGSIKTSGQTINMGGGEIHGCDLVHSRNNHDITLESKGTGDIILKTNSINRLTINDTGAWTVQGGMSYNNSTDTLQVNNISLTNINGSAYPPIVSNVNINDVNTNATFFPVFVDGSGNKPLNIDATTGPFSINPSTGAFSFATSMKLDGTGGSNRVALGLSAGSSTQGNACVAVGLQAGQTNQGNGSSSSVAVGNASGNLNQARDAVAVGVLSGQNNQGESAVAIGNTAASTSQGTQAVAIGRLAGNTSQGQNAVAVGNVAGQTSQGQNAVAVGVNAGEGTVAGGGQGANAVAIGVFAGRGETSGQGASSIAIGNSAGRASQVANSICLNASGVALNPAVAGLHIDPVRNVTQTTVLGYNTTSKEITYYTPSTSITASTISNTGNITIDPSNTLIIAGDLDMSGNNSTISTSITTAPSSARHLGYTVNQSTAGWTTALPIDTITTITSVSFTSVDYGTYLFEAKIRIDPSNNTVAREQIIAINTVSGNLGTNIDLQWTTANQVPPVLSVMRVLNIYANTTVYLSGFSAVVSGTVKTGAGISSGIFSYTRIA